MAPSVAWGATASPTPAGTLARVPLWSFAQACALFSRARDTLCMSIVLFFNAVEIGHAPDHAT